MRGKNYGVCHSCRSRDHFFAECPNKRPCPWCKAGFLKCFEVEKKTVNQGRLFSTCSVKCGYWEWVDAGETSGVSRTRNVANAIAEDLADLVKSRCCLTDEGEEVEISVTVKIRNGRAR